MPTNTEHVSSFDVRYIFEHKFTQALRFATFYIHVFLYRVLLKSICTKVIKT